MTKFKRVYPFSIAGNRMAPVLERNICSKYYILLKKHDFYHFYRFFWFFRKKIIFSTKKFEPKTSPIDSSWSKTVNMKWKWRFWDKNQLFINFLNIKLKNQKGPPLWFFLRFEKNFCQTEVISPSKSTMKNRLVKKIFFLTLRITMWDWSFKAKKI